MLQNVLTSNRVIEGKRMSAHRKSRTAEALMHLAVVPSWRGRAESAVAS